MKKLGNNHYIPENGYEIVSKKDSNIRTKSLWLSYKDNINNYIEELEIIEDENSQEMII